MLWCSKSVRSEWVAAEAALAAKLDTLVPAKIEPCELRVDFRQKDYIDLAGWGGAARDHALDLLLTALEQKTGHAPQLNFKAMREYEEVWRRFGAPSLKAFALEHRSTPNVEFRRGSDPSIPAAAYSPARNGMGEQADAWIGFGLPCAYWLSLSGGTTDDLSQVDLSARHPKEGNLRRRMEQAAAPPALGSWPRQAPALAIRSIPGRLAKIAATIAEKALRRALVTRPDHASAILQAPLQLEACDGVFVSVAQPEARLCVKPGLGQSFKDCPECPEMVIVPSGSFTMGSPKDEPERSNHEGPQHKVTFAKPLRRAGSP